MRGPNRAGDSAMNHGAASFSLTALRYSSLTVMPSRSVEITLERRSNLCNMALREGRSNSGPPFFLRTKRRICHGEKIFPALARVALLVPVRVLCFGVRDQGSATRQARWQNNDYRRVR